MKNRILSLTVTLVLVLSALMLLVGCGDDREGLDPILSDSLVATVEVKCDCYGALPEKIKDGGYVAKDGTILAPTEMVIREGDTAYDLLTRLAEAREVVIDAENSAYGVYIKGINYVYPEDVGATAGWLFFVDDVAAANSADAETARDGATYTFIFTDDYNRYFN